MSYRVQALDLVFDGLVDADHLLNACLKYMSEDEVKDMLEINGLSEIFLEEEECE